MQSIESQKAYYDEYWRGVEFPVNALRLERAVFILESLLRIGIRNPKIIDLGCGTGWLASMLGHIGPTVGVELSEVAVEEASKRHPHVKFVQADILDWDPPRGEFDVVVSQEVIEHIEEQMRYLETCRMLLRPGGHLILTTPNARTFDAMPAEQREAWGIQPIEKWLTISEMRALLSPGFDAVRLTTIIPKYGERGVYRIWGSKSLKNVLRRVGLLTQFEAARRRFGFGLHLAVVARKKG